MYGVCCLPQVFYEDEGTATGHFARKQELRELKILQKIEQKQFQELAVKANFAKAEQEKKFELEKQQLLRTYDTDIEALNRQQKQQVRIFILVQFYVCRGWANSHDIKRLWRLVGGIKAFWNLQLLIISFIYC